VGCFVVGWRLIVVIGWWLLLVGWRFIVVGWWFLVVGWWLVLVGLVFGDGDFVA
jgi:hypothetical protein